MMKRTIRQTIGAARVATLAALLPLLCVSCGEDGTDPMGGGDSGIKDGAVNIGLSIQTRATDVDGYDSGDTYESYIDMAGGDYRIYFFTADNKYIATFEPKGFVAVEGNGYTTYNVLGEVPAGLVANQDDFKVVMLANWGSYEDEDFDENTTIDDICTATWSKYNRMTDFEPSPGNLIPFYGVHEYKGYTFKNNKTTLLTDDPVTLLRAMAKVEVVLESEAAKFVEVKLYHYNDIGYCAPTGIYTQDDYDHDYTWNSDYVSTLHLVNDANDTDQTNRVTDLLRTKELIKDEETKEVTQYE
ncbi:MAG: hypothetical protein LUC44_07025, partial [Prevotellaceae bacterium]|nr:hypothetical protein [Prevotellaceae bacterium]